MRLKVLAFIQIFTLAAVFAALAAPVRADHGHGNDDTDELHGTIQSLPSSGFIGDWNVSGTTVHVSASTSIEQEHGAVAVGASVEVKGQRQGDGSFTATRIEVNPTGGNNGGGDDNGGGEPGDDNGGNHGSGEPGDDHGEAKFFGTVESLPASGVGTWTVSGRTVTVTASTIIEREHGLAPAVGSTVKVEGAQAADGSFNAREIEVKTGASGGGASSSSSGYMEIRGSVESLPGAGLVGEWLVNGQRVMVSATTLIEQKRVPIARGTLVEVRGNNGPSGVIDAVRIEAKAATGASKYAKFYGAIEALPASGFVGNWTIAGRSVTVTGTTKIEQNLGSVAVGAYVEVKGKATADGSFRAVKIEVKSGSSTSAGYIEFKGTIERLPSQGIAGDWTVSGRTVHVTDGVRLRQRDGLVRVGARVEVEGNLRGDGSVDASKIDVKN